MNARIAMSRRNFLKATTTAAAAGLTGSFLQSPVAAALAPINQFPLARGGLIDTNVTLGRWPFRRVPLDDTSALVTTLHRRGVTQAWAGSFESVFHKDIAAANARLADDCQRHGHGLLVPFGTVNPRLPDWEDDLRRCAEAHQMPGIRLYPSYHGYQFDDPSFIRLLARARARDLIVQVAADLEDERTQSPLARAPHPDFVPLIASLKKAETRVVLLNWFRSVKVPLVQPLAAAGVCFDIATLEGVGGVADLIERISPERIVFGSNAPLFYFESAELKLVESALAPEWQRAVCQGNAQRLLPAHAPGRFKLNR